MNADEVIPFIARFTSKQMNQRVMPLAWRWSARQIQPLRFDLLVEMAQGELLSYGRLVQLSIHHRINKNIVQISTLEPDQILAIILLLCIKDPAIQLI